MLFSLLVVCKRTIPKIDVNVVINEHKRLKNPSSRSQSPDRQVQKIFNELNQIADKFAIRKDEGNQTSDSIYILGEDIARKEVDIVDQLRIVGQLREQLISPNAYPCTHCPLIQEHVVFY